MILTTTQKATATTHSQDQFHEEPDEPKHDKPCRVLKEVERERFLVRPAKKESDDDDDENDREDAPNAVLLAMSVNSRRSGFVHFFTSRAESRTNSFRGAMAMSATSI
jgi:hypothetical protein